jgi:hypothetical protein
MKQEMIDAIEQANREGGCAYPFDSKQGPASVVSTGMSLRDRFAIAIAEGSALIPRSGTDRDWEYWARQVWEGADWLLKTRGAPPEEIDAPEGE